MLTSRSSAVSLLAALVFVSGCASTPAEPPAMQSEAVDAPALSFSQAEDEAETVEPKAGGAGDDDGDADSSQPADLSGLELIEIVLPPIPPVALPDISVLNSTGDIVAAQLGDLVAPESGVELVSVSCADEGALVYSGSNTGDDVFDIEEDGSGTYREESGQGLVSLDVEADGSGQFYDSTSGGLVTIQVEPDGAGVYTNEQGSALTTISVADDGSGEYFSDDNEQLETVRLKPDGSGEYYLEVGDGLLTIDAQADGSGQYYHRSAADGLVTTIEVLASGGWLVNQVASSRRSELVVDPDGSGSYSVSGLSSGGFEFDSDGLGLGDGAGQAIVLPEAPRFAVADEFPSLGRLGSLAPPCATVIRFDSALLFGFGSATLLEDSAAVIAEVVEAVETVGKPVQVVGHTDSVGSEEANMTLSLARAEAVNSALLTAGLTVATEVDGVGESQPVAANESPDGEDSPSGRAQNRRVEIVIPEQ